MSFGLSVSVLDKFVSSAKTDSASEVTTLCAIQIRLLLYYYYYYYYYYVLACFYIIIIRCCLAFGLEWTQGTR